MRIQGFLVMLLITCPLMVPGCATVYNPATERQEVIFITTPMEVALGRSAAMQLAKQSAFIKNPEEVNRVTEIGERLAKVSDRTDLKYHFAVVEDKEINAFTMPGGYIYINSGLIGITKDDDELACVIGHEIGHVAARHIAKKLQAQLGYDILMSVAVQNASVRQMQEAVDITFNLVSLGYSREDELLADRLGAKYAYKAGYDPAAMIAFLKKLKEKDKDEMGPVFLRSHPYTSQRIQMMEKEIPVIISKVDAAARHTRDSGAAQASAPAAKAASKPMGGGEVSTDRPLKVMCPKCRRIFPGSVNYCPYDGTKL